MKIRLLSLSLSTLLLVANTGAAENPAPAHTAADGPFLPTPSLEPRK